ncbi:MAG TPA: hypothetical protein VNM45_10425 [Bacillus sp. (in: firmicutes)]|nr:hypothetical protein [Bacillus sp. (in: firmicutes)]
MKSWLSHLINVVPNTAIHKWYDGATDVPTKVMFDFVCKAVGGELAASDETSECRWVLRNMFWIGLHYPQSACVMRLI